MSSIYLTGLISLTYGGDIEKFSLFLGGFVSNLANFKRPEIPRIMFIIKSPCLLQVLLAIYTQWE